MKRSEDIKERTIYNVHERSCLIHELIRSIDRCGDMMKTSHEKIIFMLVINIIGVIVFVVFSHMRPLLNDPFDVWGRIILFVLLIISSIILKSKPPLKAYSSIFFAYAIALAAISVDFYVPSSLWLLERTHVSIDSPLGIALDKLDSTLIIVLIIVLFTRLNTDHLGSIYLKKGNLKKGLIIGSIPFFIVSIGSYFMAQLFGATELNVEKIIVWLPWIFLFILGNALNEELLFRGLFLGKIKPYVGSGLAHISLILPFVFHHIGVSYTHDALMFLTYLIPLAFLWSYLILKTDSLLASVLFHAATDISVILVIFSNM